MMRSTVENVTRLSTFVAATRHSIVLRFGNRNARASVRSNDDVPGPRIELRAALPQVPGAGIVNAAGFAYLPFSADAIGSPVSDGRMPTTPVPGTAAKNTGVNGRPLPALKRAVTVQSLKSPPQKPST